MEGSEGVEVVLKYNLRILGNFKKEIVENFVRTQGEFQEIVEQDTLGVTH